MVAAEDILRHQLPTLIQHKYYRSLRARPTVLIGLSVEDEDLQHPV